MPSSNPFGILPIALVLLGASAGLAQEADTTKFPPEVQRFIESTKAISPGNAANPLYSPADSLKRLQPAGPYAVELVASEPAVRQPLDLEFDDRGRLWVVQYLQYPFPAGLTITAYDQYLRAEYDRVSPPPPNHFKGADKVTILEDRDGDGVYESQKDFVTGLNLATSVALDREGVWVLQSPYLLFYPDRNHDDVPDADPEVHLTGFNFEDTHSLATSLHWGPDGWLYGATGSTTTLNIQGKELLGQGIWRYHPGTKIFEIFAEGGGNTFSLDFDRYGRAYSGTNFGKTRGLHYAQGATYIKGWTKHGPAMNPFHFGHFEHMEHEGYGQRFPQAFLFYEGGLFPELQGQIVVGMSLTNRVQASEVFKNTSTFRTVDRQLLIDAEDKSFRPVDVTSGPDGAIYIADWYDARLGYLDPDKKNGRIFRLVPKGHARTARVNLRQASPEELFGLLSHANRWQREEARKILGALPADITAELRAMLARRDDLALEALWILNLRGELDGADLRRALGHANEHVRRWAVRLLGDRNSVDPAGAAALAALARAESAPEVRSQLASSARRLPAGQAFPIIRELLLRDADADDLHIPLLVWWAVESKLDTGREELLALLRDPAIWNAKIFSRFIAGRIGQRYAADQGPNRHYNLRDGVYSGWIIDRWPPHLQRNLEMAARVLRAAPTQADADRVIAGLAAGLTGPPLESAPPRLKELIAQNWSSRPRTVALTSLAARLGLPEALPAAVAMARSGKLNTDDQQHLIDLFAATESREGLALIGELLRAEKKEERRRNFVESLGRFNRPEAADVLLKNYGALGPRSQIVAQRLLSEKPAWALTMLQRMNEGSFEPRGLSSTNLAAIRAHKNPQIDSLLARVEQQRASDPAQRMAEELFEEGKKVYALNCSACHQVNGQGLAQLAPSLVASPFVQQGAPAMVRIVLHGKDNPGNAILMPPLGHLSDRQIAAAITYVRREFGNQDGIVPPDRVAEIRAATRDRQKSWSDQELSSLKR